jgi:hypothetical protein
VMAMKKVQKMKETTAMKLMKIANHLPDESQPYTPSVCISSNVCFSLQSNGSDPSCTIIHDHVPCLEVFMNNKVLLQSKNSKPPTLVI